MDMKKIFVAVTMLAVFFFLCGSSFAAGIDGYLCKYDEEYAEWYWMLNGELFSTESASQGSDTEGEAVGRESEVQWLAVSRHFMEGVKDGIVFYVMKEDKYFFLPYERAHMVDLINFSHQIDKMYNPNAKVTVLDENHINIIWSDVNADGELEYFEKGFSFPDFKEQGSDDAPTVPGVAE